MDINITEKDDVFYYQDLKSKKIFLKFSLNIIFYISGQKNEIMICKNSIDKTLFMNYFNQAYYILIFGNNFINYDIINFIVKKLDLNLLKFIPLDVFYITGICNINNNLLIDFENIYNNNNIIFNHKLLNKNEYIKYDNSKWDDNNLSIIEDNITKFIESIEDIKIKIKDFTLEELDIKKTYINNKFLKFKLLLEKTDKMYNTLSEKIIKLENEINDNTKENNNKEFRGSYFESQNKYILNILDLIQSLDNNKKNKLSELEKYEKEISNRKHNIVKLNNDIQDLDKQIEYKNKTYENLTYQIQKNEEINNNNDNNSDILIKPLGVFVHLYNILVWDDISKYLKTLNNSGYKFDLYVNIANSDTKIFKNKEYVDLKNKILDNKIYDNIYLTFSDNRGMDIGGFFISYIKMLEMKLGYENIIKIHSKTNNNWRFAMMYAILGNKNIIDNNFIKMKQGNIGMIGNQVISLTNIINKNSYNYIHSYLKRFQVKYNNKGGFIPGTIFMIKGSVLRKFFNIQNLKDSYNEFEKDYCGSKINNREGKPHAFERFFGFMVDSCNLNTVSFDS